MIRRSTPRPRKLRGQFTVGLAFGLTFILVIFSLIFHSGIMTREKMKLQATTDLAALQASAYQRDALNEIRRINQSIETDYAATQTSLTAPLPPCKLMYGHLFGMPGKLFSTLSPFTSLSLGSLLSSGGDPCDKACSDFDSFIHSRWIDTYRYRQSDRAAKIMSLVKDSNKQAFEFAEEVFFIFENLPLGVQQRLREKYSGRPTSDQILSEYRNGQLEELDFMPLNRDTPLFAPYQERRQMMRYKYKYVTMWAFALPPAPPTPLACQYTGVFTPRPRLVPVKIAKRDESSYVTSFLAMVRYLPKHLSRFAFKLKWWGPAPPTEEGDPTKREPMTAKTVGGEEIEIIQGRHEMSALSLAKPFGGTFPEAGALANPVDIGTSGDAFKGSRLVGLADKEAQGGELIPFEFQIPIADVSGRTIDVLEFGTKDVLH